jgi:hypothetical protein
MTIPADTSTETLDKLYLEWSQYTGARNERELNAAKLLMVLAADCEDAAMLQRMLVTLGQLRPPWRADEYDHLWGRWRLLQDLNDDVGMEPDL